MRADLASFGFPCEASPPALALEALGPVAY
jgi:hypothetical protein